MQTNHCGLLSPKLVLSDSTIPEKQITAQILAVRKFIIFWENGNESLAREVISENYKDGTLPLGRTKGVDGILHAAKLIHTAIPKIKFEIEQLLVIGDRVITHLHFTGRFTGTFRSIQGANQLIDYIAIDIYKLHDGLIIESWHLEDNLSLYRQLGAINEKP